MIKVFNTRQEYNTYTNNGQNLVSGDLYYVIEDGGTHFTTNNIDGTSQNYDLVDGIPEGYIKPEGTAIFEQNVSNVDISNYAKATVNVPIPQGYIQPTGNKSITANGSNIDVAQYSTATVNVPIPEGYIQPSGGIIFIKNEDNVDIREYAVANVNVPQPTGNISLTENGSNIDIADYATATVNVPIPQGYIQPTGDKSITANGSNIDVAEYATATVNVPQPSGSVSITQNGTDIDIAQYATANVNVPIPSGYIVPTGNKTISANGSNIDVAEYATATVNVPQPSGSVSITQNGTDIDIAQYATANVNVPIPSGYIQPSGNITLTENGENINIAQYATATVNVITPDKEYTVIGDEITSEQTYSGEFKATSQIKKVIIPNGYTSIGNYAFYGCDGLTTVDIAGSGADVEIPNSVTSIGANAFYGCVGLTDVTIPSTVTSVSYSFVEGLPLPYIKFLSETPPSIAGSNSFTNWDNIVYVPSQSLTTYKTTYSAMAFSIFPTPNVSGAEIVVVVNQNSQTLEPFSGRTWKFFKKVYINDVEVPISKYYNVHQNDVIRGELYDQRYIPKYMFSYKNYVNRTITLPSTIEAIGTEAFSGSNIVSITINATTPPTLGTSVFQSTNANLVIYVPAESVEAYKAASGWSTYAAKIQAIPTT